MIAVVDIRNKGSRNGKVVLHLPACAIAAVEVE